jgi:maltose O-acetyltransferase
VRGRLRGWLFTRWCRAFRPRIHIGRNLFLGGHLKIRGPGSVIIGDNVSVGMTVTPFTYSREAVIHIGDNVFLNGPRFGCRQRVEIGARSILADCSISDYDFHSVDPEHRNDPGFIKCRPVTIGENVWVTRGCTIQKGVTIGRDSTIATMSVVRTSIPERCIAGGNPAIVLKRLPPAEQQQPAMNVRSAS